MSVDRVRTREDTDGCACLECRGVRSVATRRGLGDVLLWSIGLLRTRPSIVVVFLGLAALQLVGTIGSVWVGFAVAIVSFVGSLFALCYVATLAGGELLGERYPVGTAIRYALRRLPAAATIQIGVLFSMMLAIFVIFLGSITVVLSGDLRVLVAGAVVLLVLLIVFVVVATKFVLATTAAVVGGYGPLRSLRVSWRLVSFRRRTTILLVGLLVVLPASYGIAELATVTDPYPVIGNDAVRFGVQAASTVTTFLSSAVTIAVFTHVYVQGVLE
ncbi:hypothetical protein [Natrarchaeobaculum aegyptiacum]|uniref:DUF7847 domain-containing protein n=1 Tax=Natrarchaeobaculum aegyptiacum TaxID=745377 RepID=A0A2Z2HQ75_9EURY|nr:hypothetical protein [Natrarchaeobaculum aegyptiacum]ARS89072.1 hypothetical protein B1756_04405 [Natrarchaeobaculum aegyptiacum]